MPDYSGVYEDRRLALLRDFIPPGRGMGLDIGCNDGTTSALIAEKGYVVVGIDLDPDLVERARQRHPDVRFEVSRIEDLGETEQFQLITCLEVVEHLPPVGQEQLLRAIRQRLAPSGLLVLSTPGRYSFYSILDRVARRLRHVPGPYDWWDPTHVNILSVRQLRRLAESGGFSVRALVGFHYLPPRIVRPFAISWRPLNRGGFDLVLACVPHGERTPHRPCLPITARIVRARIRKSRASPWWRR